MDRRKFIDVFDIPKYKLPLSCSRASKFSKVLPQIHFKSVITQHRKVKDKNAIYCLKAHKNEFSRQKTR